MLAESTSFYFRLLRNPLMPILDLILFPRLRSIHEPVCRPCLERDLARLELEGTVEGAMEGLLCRSPLVRQLLQ